MHVVYCCNTNVYFNMVLTMMESKRICLDSNICKYIKLKERPILINLMHNSIAGNYDHTDFTLILLLTYILYNCYTSVYFNFIKIQWNISIDHAD